MGNECLHRVRRQLSRRWLISGIVICLLLYGSVFAAVAETEAAETELETEHGTEVADAPETGRDTAMLLQQVLDNSAAYPEQLIHDLQRNPELLDFVLGYPTADPTAQGAITEEEAEQDCPLFLQWDSRWGYVPYGSCVIGTSGCGPACLSMVLFHFTRNTDLTPAMLAEIAQNGYYVEGAGTAWSFLTDVAPQYGVAVTETSNLPDPAMLESKLNAGALFICSMRPGDFTDTGHFILVRGMQDGMLEISDPFSIANSGQLWSYETITEQCKRAWEFTAQ